MAKNDNTTIVSAATSNKYDVVANQFFNVDFNAMNTIIDKLANRNQLSKVEKKEANNIIDTWNDNVIQKLQMESNNITEFVDAINGTAFEGIPSLIRNQQFISELETLINIAGLNNEYDEMCDTVNDYVQAEAALKNIPAVDDDLDTTQGDLIIMQRNHDYNVAKATAEMKKIGNKLIRQNITMTQALTSNNDVKKLLTQLKRRATNMKKMMTTCTDKAQLAKINITIDDAGVRDSLKELIELTL